MHEHKKTKFENDPKEEKENVPTHTKVRKIERRLIRLKRKC